MTDEKKNQITWQEGRLLLIDTFLNSIRGKEYSAINLKQLISVVKLLIEDIRSEYRPSERSCLVQRSISLLEYALLILTHTTGLNANCIINALVAKRPLTQEENNAEVTYLEMFDVLLPVILDVMELIRSMERKRQESL